MDSFYQRALACAARAPQQGVIGWKAIDELLCIVEQQFDLLVDALQQFQIKPVHSRYGLKALTFCLPDKGF